ncbi:hypothetical protein [Pontibacter amylolyticus]|uniref:Uncharacterized protein n=1 Tax=Pontibacter amylolyticus TaxID=1424080 RepID=A0ABQ1W237_9BACT|nr:hypothetical protein [Pontibacter amylolyticus]GGG09775.1 hypothetical protein GCM10011323_12940 [Pontibacter amylolyticus]
MSEITNPLFDNERELLERQKEEYKKALMGDVDQIKTQGQQIGKKVAIAGGVLVAGLLLRSLFSGGKKKAKTLKGKKAAKQSKFTGKEADAPGSNRYAYGQEAGYTASNADVAGYDSFVHEQEDAYTLSSERMPHAQREPKQQTGVSKSFLSPELMQVISQQVMALLLVYLTKKVEEYLSTVSKNSDIAAAPIEVTEIETIAYTIPEEDAIQQPL